MIMATIAKPKGSAKRTTRPARKPLRRCKLNNCQRWQKKASDFSFSNRTFLNFTLTVCVFLKVNKCRHGVGVKIVSPHPYESADTRTSRQAVDMLRDDLDPLT